MKSFFKTIGLGAIYIVALPFAILFLALYAVYCLLAFIYIGIRSIITFFAGGTPLGDLPEDVEAKRLLMQKETQKEAMATAYAANMRLMQQPMYQQPQPQPVYPQPQQPVMPQPVFNPNQQVAPQPMPQPEQSVPNFSPTDLTDEPSQSEAEKGESLNDDTFNG